MRSGNWKYLSIESNEFVYDLGNDQRERANLGKRHPDKLAELRQRYAAWEKSIPPIPPDAKASVVYGPSDMAMPSS